VAGTTIYSTVDDVFDAAEISLQLEGIGTFRTLFMTWINEGQLEIGHILRENGLAYEALRTAGQSGSSGAIGALTAGEEDYSFVSRISAIDLDTVRDDKNSITHRKDFEIRAMDRAWDNTGQIVHFTLRPNAFKFWRVPDATYIAAHPVIYFDYFARLNKFTLETDPLTQYYEDDRLVLQKYIEYRGYQQADDTREDRALAMFRDMVMSMGSSGNYQGIGGPPTEIGLGPYFDYGEGEW